MCAHYSTKNLDKQRTHGAVRSGTLKNSKRCAMHKREKATLPMLLNSYGKERDNSS